MYEREEIRLHHTKLFLEEAIESGSAHTERKSKKLWKLKLVLV